MAELAIETFPVGMLGCNCTLVHDPVSGQAVVVDPGDDFDRIRDRLDALGAKVAAIVHTHTHIDHVGATAPLARHAGVTPQIHEDDRFLYDMLPLQAALLGIAEPARCEMRGDLHDGASVAAGAIEIGVLHTPGHTPGSVCFLLQGASGAVLFSGDTLFRGSIGRTDLWGGDSTLILRSLRERLMTLPEDTSVVPGHGPTTTIARERQSNPYVRPR
jgi:glyoxylase-like metal-dependent hydrolase (beta-lactamase superfamily II)